MTNLTKEQAIQELIKEVNTYMEKLDQEIIFLETQILIDPKAQKKIDRLVQRYEEAQAYKFDLE